MCSYNNDIMGYRIKTNCTKNNIFTRAGLTHRFWMWDNYILKRKPKYQDNDVYILDTYLMRQMNVWIRYI